MVCPTVGGQDIDSLTSLRGLANYRFREADATCLQTSYTLPVYDLCLSKTLSDPRNRAS
jgi:hypothetical protein